LLWDGQYQERFRVIAAFLVARTIRGEPFLSPASAAFVGRARQTDVSGDRPLVPQVAPENFVHQHGGCLKAEAFDLLQLICCSCNTLAFRRCCG